MHRSVEQLKLSGVTGMYGLAVHDGDVFDGRFKSRMLCLTTNHAAIQPRLSEYRRIGLPRLQAA